MLVLGIGFVGGALKSELGDRRIPANICGCRELVRCALGFRLKDLALEPAAPSLR